VRGNRFLGMWEGRSFLENVMEGDRFLGGCVRAIVFCSLWGAITVWRCGSAIVFLWECDRFLGCGRAIVFCSLWECDRFWGCGKMRSLFWDVESCDRFSRMRVL
jgi:hypothetical protein